jgi:hypothetical protein
LNDKDKVPPYQARPDALSDEDIQALALMDA